MWPDNISNYIREHLSRSSWGEGGEGAITWALHVDTVLVSWALAALMFYFLIKITGKASVRKPGKAQIVVEMLFSFFDREVRDSFPHAPPIVGPLAITIFIWVFLMNSMDLVPVDLLTAGSYLITDKVAHFKLLSTADLSLTVALALYVFFLTMYYNLKVKGVGGFLHEVASAPFGIKLLPANVLLRCVEEVAKPLSLSMRLFGNLFAAEMIFLLIAGITFVGIPAALIQPVFGGPWAIYHILVVPLQAFIFARLSIVYLAMAHEKH